jgi:hypothetical protein
MRVNDPAFQKTMNEHDPVKLMTLVRELKNKF